MGNLERFITQRNGELQTDALLQAGMGLVFGIVTFGGGWWVLWLVLGGWKTGFLAPIPLAIAGGFLAVATWSAWRGVDPYENLAPLTAAEAAQREVEDAVATVAGTGMEGLARREGLAGCATWMIAGPKGVIDGWRAWRKRVHPDAGLLRDAGALLGAAHDGPVPLGNRARAALLLVHLGLADLVAGEDEVAVVATAKGRRLGAG